MSRAPAFVALCLALAAALAGGSRSAAEEFYRIGVNDVLAVSVWDNKDIDHVVFVRPDGKISLPLLGEVQAGGLTVAELIERLNAEYGRTIRGAQTTVIVREIRSRRVYFVGGVGTPGAMHLTETLTVLQAVSLAGGLSPTADQESAFILRGERSIPVDFVKLMKGDTKQNVPLQPGDTIVVPVADSVHILGEVKTPGALKFTKDLTVVRAITSAGGFTPAAAGKRVTLLRTSRPGGKKESQRINVEAMIEDPQSVTDLPLQPNDVIFVPQRLF